MKKLATLMLLFLPAILWAQSELEPGQIQVVPPSPNVSQQNKFIDIPTNSYTGTIDVSIPITEINLAHFNLPISLSYHSSGIKVDENASWVGAGWSLNATGQISRTVNGVPDEWDGDQYYGYLSDHFGNSVYQDGTNSIDYTSIFTCANLAFTPIGPQDGPRTLADSITYGMVDTQPDIFYYTLPGSSSGKFVFDRLVNDPKPVMLEASTVEISSDPFGTTLPNPLGLYNDYSWTVVDERGIIYYFTKAERTTIESFNQGGVNWDRHQSAWYLSSIDAFGETIQFFYESETINHDTKLSESKSFVVDGPTGCATCKDAESNNNSISETQISALRLAKITSSRGHEIIFQESTASRTDLSGSHSLDKIIIKRYGQEVYTFDLTYSNYPGGKLRLDQVQTVKGTETLPAHTFEYYYHVGMPSAGSNNQDYWGYYNGATNTGRIPEYRDLDYWLNANSPNSREPVLAAAQAGALKKWNLPTGGYFEYEYELHQQYNTSHHNTTTYSVSASGYTSPGIAVEQWSSEFTIGSLGARADKIITSSTNDVFDNTGTIWKKNTSGVFVLYSPAPTAGNRLILPEGIYKLKASNSVEGDVVTIQLVVTDVATSPQNENVGGLRIKKTTAVESITGGNPITTIYKYTEADGVTSSGKLFVPFLNKSTYDWLPGEAIYPENSTAIIGCDDQPENEQTILTLSSTSIIPSVTIQGSHIGYNRVEKIQIDANGDPSNGKEVMEYENSQPSYFNYPYISGDPLEFKNGKPITHTIYRAKEVNNVWQFTKQQESSYTYSSITLTSNHAGNPAIQIPFFDIKRKYQRFCYSCSSNNSQEYVENNIYRTAKWYSLASTTTKQFDNNGTEEFSNTVTYTYAPLVTTGNHYYPIQEKQPGKDNIDLITTTERDVNFPSRITEVEMYRGSVATGNQIEGRQFTYQGTLPASTSKWKFNATSSGEYELERQNVFQGNLPVGEIKLSHENPTTQAQFGYNIAYQFGENHSFLMATAQNATSPQLYTTSFEGSQTGNWTITPGNIVINALAKTGTHEYNLGVSGSNASVANVPTGNYSFSVWARSGTLSITATGTDQGTVTFSPAATYADGTTTGWTLYAAEINFTNATNSLELTGTGRIDNLRLHPTDAVVTTYTFDPVLGKPTSIMKPNYQLQHFQYDAFGRLLIVLDGDRNLLQQHEYVDVN